MRLARRRFHQSLMLGVKSDRDTAFTRTLQILGQQMHLIADLAVPAHTRNDPHCPPPDGFEDWTDRNILSIDSVTPEDPDPRIFTLGVPIQDPIATVPVARLWDTDQYRGTNPDITANNPTISLAEYSNANFFRDADGVWRLRFL